MKKILGSLVFIAQIHAGFIYANATIFSGKGTEIGSVESIRVEPIFYPNPVKDILYLKKSAAYLIKNGKGLVVKQGFGIEINVADLPSGTYTLEVRGKTDTFVKE